MASGSFIVSRRAFLRMGALSAAAAWMPAQVLRAAESAQDPVQLTARRARVALAAPPFPPTTVWSFNGRSPGPVLRMRQARESRIRVKNELEQPLTVHWHGLRITNAMDGVPVLTQPPIETGGEFEYVFTPSDAGTFWYHSHVNTAEQIGRGLYGPLIVEEGTPPVTDRELLWVLDDWRLDGSQQIVGDFGNPRDLGRAGRLGNTVTVNGRLPGDVRVRRGERIRIRVLNAANARMFKMRFQGHEPVLIARDGQPLDPRTVSAIELGPAQRADLIIDMTGRPGERFRVLDTFFPQAPEPLAQLIYADEPLRSRPLSDSVASLPANPLPQPDLGDPQRQTIDLGGGDLGRLEQGEIGGEMLDRAELYLRGKMWSINGEVFSRYEDLKPIFTVERGRTVMLRFRNRTAWPHPMHLHGHAFRVLEHPGRPDLIGDWLDTVVVHPEETVLVAFVADNPGNWLLHCHILGHVRGGMLALVRVT